MKEGAPMNGTTKNRFLPALSRTALGARALIPVALAAVTILGCDAQRLADPGTGPKANIAAPSMARNTAGPVAHIKVTPNPATLKAGEKHQFAAVGTDEQGHVVAIKPVWSVMWGGGTISASGLFTAGAAPGTFGHTVIAVSGNAGGSATVIITAALGPPGTPIVNLGTAGLDAILAYSTVTCVTGGKVGGDIDISPGTALTGFGPCTLTGAKHLGDAVAAQAQKDLTTAYNALAKLPCPGANLITADLGGTTKPAGVYCTASGIGVTGTLTLDGGGDPNATFVFQAGSTLITAGNVVLINMAQAKNVFWQVGSSATLGSGSQWQGDILAQASITLVDNATLIGRALARTAAVTLGTNNTITLP
jgi:hypothetical protein